MCLCLRLRKYKHEIKLHFETNGDIFQQLSCHKIFA